MTYETLRNIYVIAGIASLVMLLVTVGLFFLLRIPEASAFVSGKTRKMGIEAIQRTGTASSRGAGPKSRKLAKNAKASAIPVKGNEPPQNAEPAGEKWTEVLSKGDGVTTVLESNAGGGAVETAQADHRNLVFTQQPFVVEFDITYVSSNIVIGEV